MVSDAALSFGQGVLQGMGPGLELRSRHKYAETERLARAASARALNKEEIEHTANLLADRIAPVQSEDGSETEAHAAARNGFIKYAGNDPKRLSLIEVDWNKGAKYKVEDTPRSGGTRIFGKLTRYSGLTATEEREQREVSHAVDSHYLIEEFRKDNNNAQPKDFLKLLVENELEKAKVGVQGELTERQTKRARDLGMYKLHAYYTHFSKQHQFGMDRGQYYRDASGITRKGDVDLYDLISDTGTDIEEEMKKREIGQPPTSFFPRGDETPSISLGDFSGIQQKEINNLISELRQAENSRGGKFSRENLRIIARGFVDNPDTALSSERQEDVLKLLEALLQ